MSDLFSHRDFNLISSIPLVNNGSLDQWYWAEEPTGKFSVKSLYRVIQSSKDSSTLTSQESVWNCIWKLKVPPKVQSTIWRAVSGYLPTRVQLRLHHMLVDPRCPICEEARETIRHCLF